LTLSASSERPRDRLGRPLDPGDPRAFPTVPDRDVISGAQAWDEALDCLQRDLPFHAHEIFEQRWKCAPETERDVWRALAQWGAALTQQARGNAVGQKRLAMRARGLLLHARESGSIPAEVDVSRVLDSLTQLA
jgi:hypothetical protein